MVPILGVRNLHRLSWHQLGRSAMCPRWSGVPEIVRSNTGPPEVVLS